MAGLLDFLQTPEAQLGVGLLAAAGPTPQPMSFGQRLAMATAGIAQQRDQELRRKLINSQLSENESQAQYRNAQIAKMGAEAEDIRRMQRFAFPGIYGDGATGAVQPPAQPGSAPAFGVGPGGGGQGNAPAVPSTPSAGFRIAEMSPEQVAVAERLGYKAISDLWKFGNTPQTVSANSFYRVGTGPVQYAPDVKSGLTYDPATGTASMISGADKALAALRGAETTAQELAKYPFTIGAERDKQKTAAGLDLVEVEGPDGNVYRVPRLSLTQSGGGASGMPGGAGTPGLLGGGFGNRARSNPVVQQSQIALNDQWIKGTYQPVLDAGRGASNTLAGIEAIRNIDMNTGWGTEAKATAASVLEGLGIASANAKMFATNAQKFQSVALDKVNQELLLQKGTQAKDDAERTKQTFVSLQYTPDANTFILDLAQAKANMDQRRAQYYEAALPLAQSKGDLTRIDREWRKIAGSIWAEPILQKWKK